MVRRKSLIAALALMSVLTCGGLFAADGAKPKDAVWLTNLNVAMATAKKEHKVVLADFTGSDWCEWCMKLKQEVYSSAEFQALAKDKLVLLEVDFPQNKPQSAGLKQQNKALQEKFHIEGYPTAIFLTPTGTEVGRIVGYEAKPDWFKSTKEILAKAPKP